MVVLVTGTSGKFATYLKKYVANNKTDWYFDFVTLRNDEWRKKNFSTYDSIIHCAGITSAPNDDYGEFYRINVKLTEDLFHECVRQNVKHFIYLSSMAVYDGINWGFGRDGLITSFTKPVQKSNYGKSKYEGEEVIRNTNNNCTKVAIVRAPAIVGGNLETYFKRYISFSKIPLVTIPMVHIEAKRSFVYIDTLIEYMCKLSWGEMEGIFFPQNMPQLSVSEMLFEVCKCVDRPKNMGSWGRFIPGFLRKRFFSQICYDINLSEDDVLKEISTYQAIKNSFKGN